MAMNAERHIADAQQRRNLDEIRFMEIHFGSKKMSAIYALPSPAICARLKLPARWPAVDPERPGGAKKALGARFAIAPP